MTEIYTADTDAALTAEVYRQQTFVEIVFPTYTLRAWDGLGTKAIDGDDYVGLGTLGTISVISENADATDDPVQLTLSGLDTSLAAVVKDFEHQGSPVTIKAAFFDETGTLIPDSVTVFVGAVDTMSWALGSTFAISVQADSYLRLLFRGPDGHRRMAADQEAIFPGDVGLEYASQLSDTVPWGVPTKVQSNAPQGGISTHGRIPGR